MTTAGDLACSLLVVFILATIIPLSTQQDTCLSSPCVHGTLCFNELGGYKCDCDSGYSGPNCDIPKPCLSSPCYNHGSACFYESGDYTCNCDSEYTGLRCETPVKKPCSQISDRPYPILIQQHSGGSSFFKKNWTEMLEEQGSTTDDYWLGLRELRQILVEGQGRFRLRVVLTSDVTGYKKVATYETFMIDSENENFTLTVGGWGGNIENALEHHNGMKFTTYDRDNDMSSGSNAATVLGGAFWHISTTCFACVNGSFKENFIWNFGVTYYLAKSQMYLECKEE